MTRAEDFEPIEPVLAAFRRGTKRSKLRLLTVACPLGHTLLEVFPTRVGPTALWSRRERVDLSDGQVHQRWTDVWEAEPVVGDARLQALTACSCHDNVDVDFGWLASLLASGSRRAVPPALASNRRAEEVDGIRIVWE